VTIGGISVPFSIVDDATIVALVPPGAGDAPVIVTNAGGSSPASAASTYHYT
jgi:hypothetical protein